MSRPIQQLKTTLKQSGFSLTVARQTVFAALQDQEPQSIHELAQHCQNIDRASIYRTIGLFESLGIVHRLQIGWKHRLELTDAFTHHHHHLSCTLCGKVIPLSEDPILEKRLRAIAGSQQFLAQDHQLEIRGQCKNCQAK